METLHLQQQKTRRVLVNCDRGFPRLVVGRRDEIVTASRPEWSGSSGIATNGRQPRTENFGFS